MTPAARLQAVIELLDLVERGGEPADRIVEAYFRARRYAGSRDRREIGNELYRLIRGRAALDWALERVGVRAPTARLRALVGRVALDGRRGAEIEAAFGAGGYGPAPLVAAEQTILGALMSANEKKRLSLDRAPLWARLNLPIWLKPRLRGYFGAAFEDEVGALNGPAPLDVRVNTLKTNRDRVIRRLAEEGIDAAPSPLAPHGIRLGGRVNLRGLELYRQGHVEPQDQGSQLIAAALGAGPGMQVIDLCAGAGGKTLALAAAMANSGQIHAFDIDAGRLRRMAPRLKRAGVHNVQAHALDRRGASRLEALAGVADRVLIDAPCSGIGVWRRQPEARWRLNARTLDGLVATQKRLLDSGARLVKPGGRMVYATCTLLPEENEAQVAAFLDNAPEFALSPFRLAGLSADDGTLLLTPRRHDCDGFFIALLGRGPG